MLSQEEYMDLLALKRQGLTNREIAEETGYHPATIAKWLAAGGPPAKRAVTPQQLVVDDRWAARVEELLRRNPRLLATSVFDLLRAEGFAGSYPTVVRHVRAVRGPRFRQLEVSVPIETGPGEEAQFDWSDCTDWAERWGWQGELWCLGVIWCWSRWRTWTFATSVDREHTFAGLVTAFETAGGVPQVLRTDRMGALGRSQGRRFVLHPPALNFARWHGCELKACQAGDAKRKGKIERPFRPLKESFLEELEITGHPATIGELNGRAAGWLQRRVHQVPHRVTGVTPADRMDVERGLLVPLPRARFDVDHVAARRVGRAVPLVEWRSCRYSVPIDCIGQTVEVRQTPGDQRVEVRWAGQLVAAHQQGPAGGEVWDPEHRARAEAAALARHQGRHLHAVPAPALTEPAPGAADDRLELGWGDYEVAEPDLARRYGGEICECAAVWSPR